MTLQSFFAFIHSCLRFVSFCFQLFLLFGFGVPIAFALALIPSLVLLKIALLYPFVFLAKDHFVPREGYVVT